MFGPLGALPCEKRVKCATVSVLLLFVLYVCELHSSASRGRAVARIHSSLSSSAPPIHEAAVSIFLLSHLIACHAPSVSREPSMCSARI